MSDGKIVVDQELVEHYARVKNVSLEVARAKLEESMTKEAQVDIRQQMTVLMNAFRKMSPQLHGVVLRETDTLNSIAQLRNEVKVLRSENEGFAKQLQFERDVYKRSMELLNEIIKTDEEVKSRLTKLETPSLSLFQRVVNRIKCLLNN